MRLLLIEDDVRLQRSLLAGLAEEGFSVESAGDGQKGLAALRAHRYDVCVLDINLPVLDGFAVLREARASGLSLPVLLLTARDAVPDRVRGLNEGADDYLVKPFAFAELLARLRVLLRRGSAQRSGVLRLGAVCVDSSTHEVRVADKLVELTQKQFALLECLLHHAGEVVSRAMLLSSVWGYSFDPGTNVVDVHVAQLRRRIEATGQRCPIETVRGVGYRAMARPKNEDADEGEDEAQEGIDDSAI